MQILSHNSRGFNDPKSIYRERIYFNSLMPKDDVIMIQEYKLHGRSLDNLGDELMLGCASSIFEVALIEKSWLNPNAAGKKGVGILIANKYAKMFTMHGALYENRVVWIKLEGIEGENLGSVYPPNIPMKQKHLWHLMVDTLPRECKWVIGEDFNVTERPEDKSNDCGREINDLDHFSWNEFLATLQVHNAFKYQGGALDSLGTMVSMGKQGD